MYVSFLSRRLSVHPSPGQAIPPIFPFWPSFDPAAAPAPTVGLGPPALRRALSALPPPQHESGWAGRLPVARALLGSGRLARCLPAGACCRPIAATWRAMASRSLQSQCGAQPPDHPRTMAMADAHLSSTSQKPPLPPLPTAHCFACAPATRLLHRDKPLPCHCTPFFYRIPAHYGAGFALLMVADVAQRK